MSCLFRRADGVGIIGRALAAAAGGTGHRKVAAALGRADSTVARWLRRARSNLEAIASAVEAHIRLLDPLAAPAGPTAGPIASIVADVGRLQAAYRIRFAMVKVAPWALMSLVTGGLLLSPRLPAARANTR